MKALFVFLFLCASSCLHAQEEDQVLLAKQEFQALSKNEQKQFIGHLKEAHELYSKKRIFETLEELNKAEKIFKNDDDIYTLRGACYTEMENYEQALATFEAAMKFNPKNFNHYYNRAEILLAIRDWQKAHDGFLAALDHLPITNEVISRPIEFRIFVCKIQLGKAQEAQILAEKYDYTDDSPYYYYVQATYAFEAGEIDNAQGYLNMASRVFPNPALLTVWNDPLVTVGHLKNLRKGQDNSSQKIKKP